MAVALTLLVKVPAEALARGLPISPPAVGEALAEQVQRLTREENLAYYPALAYCHGKGALDPDSLTALESVAEMAEALAKGEIRACLRPRFREVEIESVQPLAYTMPTARPRSANGWWELVEHFTPDQLKLNLRLRRREADQESPETAVAEEVKEALAGRFARLAITSARRI
jgi:hypothetical protein